jgi:hypothetical protein
MENRVGQHCSAVLELLHQFSRKSPDRSIQVKNVPRYAGIVKNGVGYYYHNPASINKKNLYFN